MTSPSQLKYLQAIGIPVWVSRELVLEEEIAVLDDEVLTDKSVDDSSSESVNKILHDLETQEIPEKIQAEKAVSNHKSSRISQNIDIPTQQQATNSSSNVLGQTPHHTVYGCGSFDAEWMVIGESPEFINDDANQPYADESGVLLVNMLRAVGIDNPRNQAYLVNVLVRSQRDEQNKTKELNQLLLKTINQVQPKMLLIVGQLAAQNLLQSKEPLARLRGKPQKLADTDISVVVTYYPSYLLSKPLDKRKAWDDLKLAMSLLD